eukprot:SAG31_NODE_9777_length_1229_cov_0.790265_1_plen_120_part_10
MYRQEWALRKKYYNQVQDLKGNIRVYARCRPLLSFEPGYADQSNVDTAMGANSAGIIELLDESSLRVLTDQGPGDDEEIKINSAGEPVRIKKSRTAKHHHHSDPKTYSFSRVFGPASSQT